MYIKHHHFHQQRFLKNQNVNIFFIYDSLFYDFNSSCLLNKARKVKSTLILSNKIQLEILYVHIL